jgi:hypothetical protein
VWHVSLSYWSRGRDPVALDQLDRDQRRRLHAEALRQLDGVGDHGLERWDAGDQAEHVVHLRRALTEAEELLLSIAFRVCPAVDVAGPVKPIDLTEEAA